METKLELPKSEDIILFERNEEDKIAIFKQEMDCKNRRSFQTSEFFSLPPLSIAALNGLR